MKPERAEPLGVDLSGLLPAVAAFADPLLAPAVGRDVAVDMRAVLSAIADLDGFAPVTHRMAAAARVHAVAAEQAECLSGQLPNRYQEPEPRSVAQRYFRIRTSSLSADQALWHCLRVIADAADDLVNVPISGSDLHRMALAAATVLGRMPGPERSNQKAWSAERPALARQIEEMWFRRWIIGHQLHAMLNVCAAHALADAADALRERDTHRAVVAIDDATRMVEGFSAARAQALAVPAVFYQDVLRPTMLPPLTEAPLSGRMHVEYRGYRRRLAELLELIPLSGARLAAVQPALALARERLLEADLIEAERHVTSVEPLVGDSRSLIQTGKSTENAVSALRQIRHHRAAQAAEYVRFPDRVAQGTNDAVDRCTAPLADEVAVPRQATPTDVACETTNDPKTTCR
jgi:hypothetical protein